MRLELFVVTMAIVGLTVSGCARRVEDMSRTEIDAATRRKINECIVEINQGKHANYIKPGDPAYRLIRCTLDKECCAPSGTTKAASEALPARSRKSP